MVIIVFCEVKVKEKVPTERDIKTRFQAGNTSDYTTEKLLSTFAQSVEETYVGLKPT